MATRDSIETAYSFFHQKLRVYEHSTLAWQRDDIEWAIGDYVSSMNPDLYASLAHGRADFLRDHELFETDLRQAVDELEAELFG